ncbi:sensor domain-containing diguanylate cyclase [Thiomicrospira sp.]|uniref:sensor domain-containing diguanylate cyclase n=1 Tax=Thiomicrospira sp. TaxID=935 RepID=UPI002F91C479
MNHANLEQQFIQLQEAMRPLLELIKEFTSLETIFVTYIDPVLSNQKVIVLHTDGALALKEGAEVDWSDSMCRLIFNEEQVVSDQIDQLFPLSTGADLGMKTFFALPVNYKQNLIGSLCGASTRRQSLSEDDLSKLNLIAKAISYQIGQWQHLVKMQQKLEQADQQTQNLKKLAETDPLTELYNRRGFARCWKDSLDQTEKRPQNSAILAIDIDQFKQLNDHYGHDLGDQVLCTLSDLLRRLIRESDFASRAGGDEFILVLPDTNLNGCQTLANRLQSEFSNALIDQTVLTDQTIKTGLSIGIAHSQTGLHEDMLLLADKALYQAKALASKHVVCLSWPNHAT